MQNKINEIVKLNNQRLNKEIEIVEVKDNLGNVKYETTYVKEIWFVERNVSRSGRTNINLIYPLKANQGKGALTTLVLKLSKLEIEYITNKAGVLNDGGKLKLKTRFMYGFQSNGQPYFYVGVLIGGKYLNSTLLEPMQTDIIMSNMEKLETSYNIHLELKNHNEELDVLDITGDLELVDID